MDWPHGPTLQGRDGDAAHRNQNRRPRRHDLPRLFREAQCAFKSPGRGDSRGAGGVRCGARPRRSSCRARPGVKIWSAGHDVDELPEGRRDPLGWYDPLRRLIRGIETHPAPIIAMIEGGVWGGACEAAMACDINHRRRERDLRADAGQARRALQCLGHADLPQQRAATGDQGDGVHRPSDRRRSARSPPASSTTSCLWKISRAFTYDMAADIVANAPLSISVMKEELRILADAHPMSPRGLRARAGPAAHRLRQRRLRRGRQGVQGEAQAGLSGGVVRERGAHGRGRIPRCRIPRGRNDRHRRRLSNLIDRLPRRLRSATLWLLKPESRWARIPAGFASDPWRVSQHPAGVRAVDAPPRPHSARRRPADRAARRDAGARLAGAPPAALVRGARRLIDFTRFLTHL